MSSSSTHSTSRPISTTSSVKKISWFVCTGNVELTGRVKKRGAVKTGERRCSQVVVVGVITVLAEQVVDDLISNYIFLYAKEKIIIYCNVINWLEVRLDHAVTPLRRDCSPDSRVCMYDPIRVRIPIERISNGPKWRYTVTLASQSLTPWHLPQAYPKASWLAAVEYITSCSTALCCEVKHHLYVHY